MDNPYHVENLEQLQEVESLLNQHFIQIADIDASATGDMNNGLGFKPIGIDINRFSGSFEGNGFVIENLIISRPNEDFIGLFGSIENGGEIRNVALVNADIRGGEYTGALAGVLIEGGIIMDSWSGGTVSGGNRTGGLVGRMDGRIEMNNKG